MRSWASIAGLNLRRSSYEVRLDIRIQRGPLMLIMYKNSGRTRCCNSPLSRPETPYIGRDHMPGMLLSITLQEIQTETWWLTC